MDISAFYQTFFDEADELIADMEQHLLMLDPEDPDIEQLNAIFRAAHSIKGGAATFGFTVLQETTHIFENLLDGARRQQLTLNTDIVNLFLETKDIMQEQLDAYKNSQEQDQETFKIICDRLKALAESSLKTSETSNVETPKAVESNIEEQEVSKLPEAESTENISSSAIRIELLNISNEDESILIEELGNLGKIVNQEKIDKKLVVHLETVVPKDDIVAVLCFVIDEKQITIIESNTVNQASTVSETLANDKAAPVVEKQVKEAPVKPSISDETEKTTATAKANTAKNSPVKNSELTSIRVAVEKVDQIINLVGELVITQSMLAQRSDLLDPVQHGELLSSMTQLQRNARDLQESVMSIRMMPMEYVFSRFPRQVRDLAARLNKRIELVLQGSSTELDKSLIERIIDPLTHLVRNSVDHGIESPEVRASKGKPELGILTLSAEHQGGNICIEVKDDGGGLNREKILKKAISQGMQIPENISDEEVNMLILAPGFSTADTITDVSGRGVGLDVVRRNIQEMGGQIEIQTVEGKGTSFKILLPLTLAILDGMSVKVGEEVFILPLGSVMESLQPQSEDIHSMAGDEKVLQVRGEFLPLVELYQIFDVKNAKPEPTEGIVVIIQAGNRRYALLVDQLIGQHQVVVKNLESNYKKVPGVSAATILGDGSVALIVDVSSLQSLHRDKRFMHNY
ncbi:CheA signal transduction histidine kinase [Thorsellia anophelis DSM 18579]|uniref:Chemotaxis protein CheA n=2 Tax=Thorsellia anophelis TaxID=336804 RepID=A0A1I0BX84_9GAMM|nr:chemotaxis protein CheA [Thorsellia anophelis]SET11761.1 CheA signal transduction histidine kinase [Thorsellia anophelis DSM 18579]